MPKFAKILLVILIVLVAVGLLLAGYLWFKARGGQPVINENINQPVINQPVDNNTNINVPPVTNINTNVPVVTDPNVLAEQRAKRLATLFAEKFGTYSSQGDFENFKELYDLMTPKMKNWAKSQVDNRFRLQDPYAGVTTRALRAEIIKGKITDDNIQIIIDTQREKSSGTTTNVVYEILRLEMVKSGSSWLVDGAYWE
jgi:hypothetical protein